MISEHYGDVLHESYDPEFVSAFYDFLLDLEPEDFGDQEYDRLFWLDIELTKYAPPARPLEDLTDLVARPLKGVKLA